MLFRPCVTKASIYGRSIHKERPHALRALDTSITGRASGDFLRLSATPGWIACSGRLAEEKEKSTKNKGRLKANHIYQSRELPRGWRVWYIDKVKRNLATLRDTCKQSRPPRKLGRPPTSHAQQRIQMRLACCMVCVRCSTSLLERSLGDSDKGTCRPTQSSGRGCTQHTRSRKKKVPPARPLLNCSKTVCTRLTTCAH